MPSIPDRIVQEINTHKYICGSDEVGYGAWAGPLVVCAAVASQRFGMVLSELTDSKKLTATQREDLYRVLVKTIIYTIVRIEPEEIDNQGLGKAWKKAHITAIQEALKAHKNKGHEEVPFVIIDGNRPVLGAIALPKADLLIPAVSMASIIAKVYRDHIMYEMDEKYPGYGFKNHVGYGTPEHQTTLKKLGVTPIHRKSYAPIAALIKPEFDAMDLMSGLEQDA
jgi:ribonuclease HII